MPRQFGKVDASSNWSCDKCLHKHAPDARCSPVGVWLGKGTPSGGSAVWLKRPMPDGQWPVNQRAPRDDSFSWWVRSACGHVGGARQWAFTEERYADWYGELFRERPCHFNRCPESMIKNVGG